MLIVWFTALGGVGWGGVGWRCRHDRTPLSRAAQRFQRQPEHPERPVLSPDSQRAVGRETRRKTRHVNRPWPVCLVSAARPDGCWRVSAVYDRWRRGRRDVSVSGRPVVPVFQPDWGGSAVVYFVGKKEEPARPDRRRMTFCCVVHPHA